MKCFFCNRDAISKIHTEIDGHQQEVDVCGDHLRDMKEFNFKQMIEQMLLPFAITSFMFGEHMKNDPNSRNRPDEKKLERCPECYDIFQKHILPLMDAVHATHNKKRDTTGLYRLKRDLEVALKEERYEDAARIRDQIRKEEGPNGKK